MDSAIECGIAGVVGPGRLEDAVVAVRPMLRSPQRRRPDAEGLESWGGAVLRHRRLPIFVDLSQAGRQPTSLNDRTMGVVLNGTIYNLRSLREDLGSHGHRFRSQAATEVLVNGYREWGIDELVARLRGVFAFAIWDDRRQSLMLVRDRLGVKPLLYSVSPGSLTFASTARALVRAGVAGTINDRAVMEFLEYGFITDSRSIYREVAKLPAASILEWTGGAIVVRRYWHPLEAPTRTGISFGEAVEETERLFLRAVEKRLDADVPVGALLSGGIDSALVCWATKRLGADITAYTLGTPGSVTDETEDAARTATEIGVRHAVLPLRNSHDEIVPQLVAAYGEPFASGSALGVLQISRTIRQFAAVALTGDGGDDVFLGYPWYRTFLWTQRAARWIPAWAAGLWREYREAIPPTHAGDRVKHLVDYATGGLGSMVRTKVDLARLRRMGALGERLNAVPTTADLIPECLVSARTLLKESLAFAQNHHFVAEFMTKLDRGTTFHALEARSPFLDQELWEFAASLPYEIRLYRGQLKAVLRAIARRRIGERVAAGGKRGFNIPVQRWLVEHWHGEVLASFSDSLLARHGYVHNQALLRCLTQSREAGAAPLILWNIYLLERWLQAQQAAGLVSFE